MSMFLSAIVQRPSFLRHLFALALLLAMTGPAMAQKHKAKSADAEDVVIAFYKTGAARPNFKKWVELREPYLTTPLARRPELMESELKRLNDAYDAFNPITSLITIRTTASASVNQYQDPDNPEELITLLEMRFPVGDADYFPYDLLDERFAVIPKDLRRHMKPRLQNEQYDYMKSVLRESRPVTMIMELRPLKANMEAPFSLDAKDGEDADDEKGQWMFLTDIATMSVWTRSGTMLWEYTAPWYMTPMRDSLLDLHTDKADPATAE